MLKSFAFSLIGLVVVSSGSLMAQDFAVSSGSGYVPYGFGGYSYHASTAAEGFQRGRAAVINATGQYNKDTAQAMISYEQARALAIENNRAEVSNYFQRKEINRQYREAAATPASTSEDLAQQAKNAMPDRLNKYELDPVFGTVTWPVALQGSEFAQYRAEVERSFRNRDITNSGLGSQVHRTVANVTEDMEATLKAELSEFSPMEYIQAKKFLKSLALESRFSPSIQGVAAITP